MTNQPHPGRRITVHAPGQRHEYRLHGDATITIDVDDIPTVGFDSTGAGWWPDPDNTWQRLHPAGTETDRSVAIDGITTEAMWRDLERALGLPLHGLGPWKQWAADRTKLLHNTAGSSTTYDLDAAIEWATTNGLPYEDERTIRHDPTTPTTTAGPRPALIQINPTALHTWLANAQHRGDDPGPLWRPTTTETATLLHTLTNDHTALAQQAWTAPRTTAIHTHQLTNAQIIITADLTPHGRIATTPLTDRDISPNWPPDPTEAAAHAITGIAQRLNQADPGRHRPHHTWTTAGD
ncbi:hypothetical protein [Polymorphospora sp. NPDC050346]|uniref:hypothetical protein n=1 Tax=Polymorphospora sp. NPDC050346 TaxID=3155780 RepID=UPI0033D4813A